MYSKLAALSCFDNIQSALAGIEEFSALPTKICRTKICRNVSCSTNKMYAIRSMKYPIECEREGNNNGRQRIE